MTKLEMKDGSTVDLELTPGGLLEVEKKCGYKVTEIIASPEKAAAGEVEYEDVLKTLYAGYKGANTNTSAMTYKQFTDNIKLDLGGIYDAFFDLLFPGALAQMTEAMTETGSSTEDEVA